MEVTAEAKYIRISPRKVRLVVNPLRGMRAEKALEVLKFVQKRAARPVAKVIASAINNAVANHNRKKDNLFIKSIQVCEGPRYKRRDKSKRAGRFGIIQKRTSHIKVVLEEKKNGAKS